MKLRQGNMWDHLDEYDYVMVTTNSFLRKDGHLVMGKGAAKEAADRYPDLPRVAGAYVKAMCGHMGSYYCEPSLFHAEGTYATIGIFQVKYHFKEPADLVLIKDSVDSLAKIFRSAAHSKAALNFPGIGNGKLKREDVVGLLEELPDNIDIWEY